MDNLANSWAGEAAFGLICFLSLSSIAHQAWKFCKRRAANSDRELLLLIIWDTRMSLYIPFLSVIQLVVSIVPTFIYYSEIPISVFEGYSIACFLAIFVVDSGGMKAIRDSAISQEEDFMYVCCGPLITREDYLRRAQNAVFFALFLRPIFMTINCLSVQYLSKEYSSLIQIAIQTVASLLLFYALFRCIYVCK